MSVRILHRPSSAVKPPLIDRRTGKPYGVCGAPHCTGPGGCTVCHCDCKSIDCSRCNAIFWRRFVLRLADRLAPESEVA